MKRTKEKTEIEIEDEERQQMFRNQITNAMRHQGSVILKMNLYILILRTNWEYLNYTNLIVIQL